MAALASGIAILPMNSLCFREKKLPQWDAAAVSGNVNDLLI